MTEKEFERKLIIGSGEYEELSHYLSKHSKQENIMQINYYYDTPDFTLFNASETLRIRQIGDMLKLQYKYNKNYSGDIRISDEYSEKISELPKTITVNGVETQNIGFMLTERINFSLKNCIISLDKNLYLGIVDFEIEVETEKESDLPDILKNLTFNINSSGKYSRFAEKLQNQGLKYELQP